MNDEPCMCGTPFTCMADDHTFEVAKMVNAVEPETGRFREPEGREHLVYTDEWGRPDECIEECPGCHWEGNTDCEALASGCDLCDPNGWAIR